MPGQPADLQSLLDAAAARGGRVDIPEGVHRLPERLLIREARDLVLDGHGATLVFTSRASAGISLERSHGVTLRNFTIDHDPVPFTQGEVVAIDPAGRWIDVGIDCGYDTTVETFQRNRAMHHFDPATLGFKHDGAWMGPRAVTSPRPGLFRAEFDSSVHSDRYNAAVGDLFAFTAERPSHAVLLRESYGTRVEAVTVLSSPGTGVLEVGGGGSHLSYRILRGPLPAGATRPRLLSTCADGLWSTGTKGGAHLEACEMEYVGDTGVNIHGAYREVIGVSGAILATRQVHARAYLEAGDRLLIYDPRYRLKGETRVEGATEETVQVADASALRSGDFIISPDRVGSGASIRGCTFREVEWEAALMRVSDGSFEDNLVDRTTCLGVWLGPEFGVYVEPDFVRNYVIRGNTFRGLGMIRPSRYESNQALGVISVGVSVPFMGRLEETQPLFDLLRGNRQNSDIHIENNVVEDCAVCGLYLSNTARVRVAGNRFCGTNALPPRRAGALGGVTPHAAIYVRDAEQVTFEDNVVTRLGQYGEAALQVDASAQSTSIDVRGIRGPVNQNRGEQP